jgi:Tol biopolymer transport system component
LTFNASNFGPGCTAAAFGSACQNFECGGLACGGCPDNSFCDGPAGMGKPSNTCISGPFATSYVQFIANSASTSDLQIAWADGTGQPLTLMSGVFTIYSPFFEISPDGRHLYALTPPNPQGIGVLTVANIGESFDQVPIASSASWGDIGIAPDSQTVVFNGTVNGIAGLWSALSDGSSPIYLGDVFLAGNFDNAPPFSTDGAHAVVRSNSGSIEVVNLHAGSAVVPVVTAGGGYMGFSPDNTQLAFINSAGFPSVVASDGAGSQVVLSQTSVYDYGNLNAAQWSPDSQHFAFTPQAGPLTIVTTTTSTTPLTVPFDGGANGFEYSPDGTHLFVFSEAATYTGTLSIVASDGSSAPVQVGTNVDLGSVQLSPDGLHLAFATKDLSTLKYSLYVTNADGSGAPTSVAAMGIGLAFAFTPDATHLVLSISTSTSGQMESIDAAAAGTPVVIQTFSPNIDTFVAASPDSVHVAFGDYAGSLYIGRVDGTGVAVLVTSGLSQDPNPAFVFSPDGSKLLFFDSGGANQAGSLMMINGDGSGSPILLGNSVVEAGFF